MDSEALLREARLATTIETVIAEARAAGVSDSFIRALLQALLGQLEQGSETATLHRHAMFTSSRDDLRGA